MPQSILNPAGPAAASIETLWWVFFWILTVVFVLVMGALVYGALRRHERGPDDLEARLRPDDRRANRWVLISGAAIPLVILIGLFAYTMTSLRALRAHEPAALVIDVVGYDWWWDIVYHLPDGGRVITANELHLPVGVPVELRLRSADVIHSFWVPRLAGKLDMIPGRTNVLRLTASEPGVSRGQCAEYCGVQHTRMGMLAIAQPPEEFAAWLERQARPAEEPETALEAAGRDVFMRTACRACHRVAGTEAVSRYGPDLTHLASRRTIAAAMLPNTPGHVSGWIANPQELKPGVNMPAVPLEPLELRALTAYLSSLE